MPIYKDHIKSKLPKSETNIFTIMSQLANNHNAINLSQGFPDFDVDPLLINTVKKYLDKKKIVASELMKQFYKKIHTKMFNKNINIKKKVKLNFFDKTLILIHFLLRKKN